MVEPQVERRDVELELSGVQGEELLESIVGHLVGRSNSVSSESFPEDWSVLMLGRVGDLTKNHAEKGSGYGILKAVIHCSRILDSAVICAGEMRHAHFGRCKREIVIEEVMVIDDRNTRGSRRNPMGLASAHSERDDERGELCSGSVPERSDG